MNPAIDNVLKSLEENTFSSKRATKVLFADKKYREISFSENNFNAIKESTSCHKIAALDGGNAEIAGAPNFSLHILRFACVVFEDNKRVRTSFKDTFDAYCLAQAKAEGDKIVYDVEIFPRNTEDNFFSIKKLSFDSYDPSLGAGIFRAEVSRACTAARRMLEWEFAQYVLNHLSVKDIVVIDGSLQTGMTGENEYSKRAYDAAKKSGAILSGLAKTSRLFTDAGSPAASAILSMEKEGVKRAWDYHPVVEINNEDHRADMHFVKLHESSRYAMRFEIFIEQKEFADEVLSLLSKNSVDLSFLGYPYALVAAHNSAKIRPEEVTTESAMFLSRAGSGANKITLDGAAADAHGVLDRRL